MTSTTQRVETPLRLRRALARPRLRPRATAVQMLAALAALGVAVLVLGGQELSWLAGLVAGAAATAWFTLARAPQAASAPTAAAVVADNGEGSTREQLDRLRDAGWRSVHDLEARFGHYRHVAVGPGGVLLLDSRQLEHSVTAADHGAASPQTDRELMRLRRYALTAAANLREELEAATGRPSWVQPVIVVWSPFPAGYVQDGRCAVVSGPRLVDWLRRRPGQLAPERADALHAALRSLAA